MEITYTWNDCWHVSRILQHCQTKNLQITHVIGQKYTKMEELTMVSTILAIDNEKLNLIALGCNVGNDVTEAQGLKTHSTWELTINSANGGQNIFLANLLLHWDMLYPYLLRIFRDILSDHIFGIKQISRLVWDELGFQATTHEPCLYFCRDPSKFSFSFYIK